MRRLVLGAAAVAIVGLLLAYASLAIAYFSIRPDADEILRQAERDVGALTLPDAPSPRKEPKSISQRVCAGVPAPTFSNPARMVDQCIVVATGLAWTYVNPTSNEVIAYEKAVLHLSNERIEKIKKRASEIAAIRRETFLNEMLTLSQIIAGFGFPLAGLMGFVAGALVEGRNRI